MARIKNHGQDTDAGTTLVLVRISALSWTTGGAGGKLGKLAVSQFRHRQMELRIMGS